MGELSASALCRSRRSSSPFASYLRPEGRDRPRFFLFFFGNGLSQDTTLRTAYQKTTARSIANYQKNNRKNNRDPPVEGTTRMATTADGSGRAPRR